MWSLDIWGAIAASWLLLLCIVFNLIFVALTLGLWKGMEWVHDHASAGLAKAGEWLGIGREYVREGERYLVAPFIRARGRVVAIRAAWDRFWG